MKYVQAVKTADGILHVCERDAVQHARKRYDDAMTELRRKLTEHMGSMREAYSATGWIEENFATIATCAELLDDTRLEEEEHE